MNLPIRWQISLSLEQLAQLIQLLLEEIKVWEAPPTHIVCGDEWTPREVVAHLSAWNIATINMFQSLKYGTPIVWIAEDKIDVFNHTAVADRAPWNWANIVLELEATSDALIKAYRSLRRVNDWQIPIGPEGITALTLIQVDVQHYREHLAQIAPTIRLSSYVEVFGRLCNQVAQAVERVNQAKRTKNEAVLEVMSLVAELTQWNRYYSDVLRYVVCDNLHTYRDWPVHDAAVEALRDNARDVAFRNSPAFVLQEYRESVAVLINWLDIVANSKEVQPQTQMGPLPEFTVSFGLQVLTRGYTLYLLQILEIIGKLY